MVTIGHYGKAAALPAASPVFLPLLLFLVFPRVAASEGETASIKTVHSEKPYQRGSIVAGDADKFFAEDQRVHDSSQAAKKQENLRRRKRSSSLSASDLLRRSVTVAKLSSRVLRFGLLVIFVAASLWGLARVVMQCLRKAELWKQSGSAGSNPRLLGDGIAGVCGNLVLDLPDEGATSAAKDSENTRRTFVTRRRRQLLLLGLETVLFLVVIAALGYVVATKKPTEPQTSPPPPPPQRQKQLQSLQDAPRYMFYLAVMCNENGECDVEQTEAIRQTTHKVKIGDTPVKVIFSTKTQDMLNRHGVWDTVADTCARQALEALGDDYEKAVRYRFTCAVYSAGETSLEGRAR